MDILLIIYNIGLFILFTVVTTLGIITYLQQKRPFFSNDCLFICFFNYQQYFNLLDRTNYLVFRWI